MKLLIISGLSGSGKSVALHTLEDEGYYCIDNLHLGLLVPFVNQMLSPKVKLYERAAVGIDARSGVEELERFNEILEEIKTLGVEPEIIFLEAEPNTLLKRFSETRRKHPLTQKGLPLVEAIHLERTLLSTIAVKADLVIDTTRKNVHQLRALIRDRVGNTGKSGMSILFQSFGFKHGVAPDSDFVFDVRCLPNPHWEPNLRALTGKDEGVIDYLQGHDMVESMYQMIEHFMGTWIPKFQGENRSYLTVSIGCTGGQHRSVYLTERLADHFHTHYGEAVQRRHRELD
jgi:UPF0042 nucleotide-binding protein